MNKIKLTNFSLEQTLECGQCFHFEKIKDNHYVFVFRKKAYDIEQIGDELILHNLTVEEFNNVLYRYFDLETDYEKIKTKLLLNDEKLKNSIEEMSGIKIIKQDFFETLISFIISANNQILRIKKSVALISQRYGDFIENRYGIDFYAFPSPEQLVNSTNDDLRLAGVGFRDSYIIDACNKVLNGEVDEKTLIESSDEEACKILMKIKGVGIKVAGCVMLFSLNKMRSFPIDVWIKRIMQNYYFHGQETNNAEILKLANKLYSPYEGYAQQYLFHYGRTQSLKEMKKSK